MLEGNKRSPSNKPPLLKKSRRKMPKYTFFGVKGMGNPNSKLKNYVEVNFWPFRPVKLKN